MAAAVRDDMLGMARRHALIVVAGLVVAAILLIGDRVEIPIPAFAAPSVTREMSAHFAWRASRRSRSIPGSPI